MFGGIEEYVLLLAGDGGAMGRLQAFPILEGLRTIPDVNARRFTPGTDGPLVIDRPTCIFVIYCDQQAIALLRALPRGPYPVLVGVLGSDIYSFDEYASLNDIADFYVMPTDLHRRMLSYQVYRPVYTLPECLDPIGLPPVPASFPVRQARRAYWFGHSESFNKGMASLMPIIAAGLANGAIDDFQVILNPATFANRFALKTIPYGDDSFRADASQFDYAILSHFPLDLHINSFIKSPNKAITALMAGTIPLVSDTPSYRALFERFGLENFLFGSPGELAALMRRLDPAADSAAIHASGIIPTLRAELSEAQLLKNILAIVGDHVAREPVKARHMPAQCVTVPQIKPGLRDHLRGLRRWCEGTRLRPRQSPRWRTMKIV